LIAAAQVPASDTWGLGRSRVFLPGIYVLHWFSWLFFTAIYAAQNKKHADENYAKNLSLLNGCYVLTAKKSMVCVFASFADSFGLV